MDGSLSTLIYQCFYHKIFIYFHLVVTIGRYLLLFTRFSLIVKKNICFSYTFEDIGHFEYLIKQLGFCCFNLLNIIKFFFNLTSHGILKLRITH